MKTYINAEIIGINNRERTLSGLFCSNDGLTEDPREATRYTRAEAQALPLEEQTPFHGLVEVDSPLYKLWVDKYTNTI